MNPPTSHRHQTSPLDTELTAPLSISMPAVSRHLEAAPLREAADWIERYSSLTRLDAHLAAVQAAGPAAARMAEDPKELE